MRRARKRRWGSTPTVYDAFMSSSHQPVPDHIARTVTARLSTPSPDGTWAPAHERVGTLVVGIACLVGIVGFVWPFLLPLVGADVRPETGRVTPLLLASITGLSLVAILADLGSRDVRPAKVVALLGVLVAINAVLRLLPTFLGASPVFLLIILAGAVFGAAVGFQVGALTILVSSFLTGGIGPWLPYQMLGAGWVGLSAGWLPRDVPSSRGRLVTIAVFGAAWGLLYGALLNLSFWPFTAPADSSHPGLAWSPGMSLAETFSTYARFYTVTSLPYDAVRSIANVALILALGGPILRLLERYRRRFTWQPIEFDSPPSLTTDETR